MVRVWSRAGKPQSGASMLSTLAVDGVLHKGVDNCMSGLCGAAVKRVAKISPRIHVSWIALENKP